MINGANASGVLILQVVSSSNVLDSTMLRVVRKNGDV